MEAFAVTWGIVGFALFAFAAIKFVQFVWYF
jgi:hypothetical protein